MTFRIALLIGVLILGLLAPRESNAQSQPGKPESYAAQPLYEMAYDTLRAMLDGQKPISFKRAVFLTENAYLEGRLDWSAFDRSIRNLARFTDLVRESRTLLYDGPDSLEVQRNAAIFSVMMDSLPLLLGSDTVWLQPMGYDFQDFNGRLDWSQMFVSKLLESGKGNCHSLPFLYKILADETGARAWLSMSPNHTYIKARTEKDGWYNTELTSGYFPHDAWIMASGYIHLDAIRNSLYMDTLSDREAIAAVMVDLATGYERKYGTHHPEGADFVLEACSTALEAYPEFANALLLMAETQRKQLLQRHGLSFGATTVPPSLREDSAFQSLTDQYGHLHRLGYRRMPDAMYLDWLWSLKQNAESFDDQDVIRYRPPPNYEPDNPFKDLGYENEVLTLSKGKYIEDFDLDSLERIGGTVYNWQTGRIAGFVLADTVFSEYSLEPEVISRWLSPDPLADEFPGWSPYVFTNDNPVMLVDPDGRAARLPNGLGNPASDLDDNFLPTTHSWIPVTKKKLVEIGISKGLLDRSGGNLGRFNSLLGNGFENSILNYANFEKNRRRLPVTVRRHHGDVVPDFVRKAKGTELRIPSFQTRSHSARDAQLMEITNHEQIDYGEIKSTPRLSKSSNDYQLAGMVEAIGNASVYYDDGTLKGKINEVGGGILYLVTTADTKIGLSLLDYASEKGVDIFQSEMYLDPQDESQTNFKLSEPRQLNKAFDPGYARNLKIQDKFMGRPIRGLTPGNGSLEF